jgi:hypothetical protein
MQRLVTGIRIKLLWRCTSSTRRRRKHTSMPCRVPPLPLSNMKGTNRKREERGFCPNLSAVIGDREEKNIAVEVCFLHLGGGCTLEETHLRCDFLSFSVTNDCMRGLDQLPSPPSSNWCLSCWKEKRRRVTTGYGGVFPPLGTGGNTPLYPVVFLLLSSFHHERHHLKEEGERNQNTPYTP